ncbi:hypothetical protein ACF06N_07270 [Streptomyces albidoflavus]
MIAALLQGLVSFPMLAVSLWFLVITTRHARAGNLSAPSEGLQRAGTPRAWVLGLLNRPIREANRVYVQNLCTYYDCTHRSLCRRVVAHLPSGLAELRRRAQTRQDSSVGHMLHAARHACTRLGLDTESIEWRSMATAQLPPAALRLYAREAAGAVLVLILGGLLAWYTTDPSAPHWLRQSPEYTSAPDRARAIGLITGLHSVLAVWWLRRTWTARWRSFRHSVADAPVHVALGLLFSTASLAGAEPGPERARLLRDVHRMGAALAEAVVVTGRRAAGMGTHSRQVNATITTDTGSFTLGFRTRRRLNRGARVRLRNSMEPHARRVADALSGLVEQLTTGKPTAPRDLAAAALCIAQACAQGRYSALLPEDQLGQDPGRDHVDGRRLALVVLGGLALAGAVTAVTTRLIGPLLPAWFGFAVFTAVFAATMLFTYGQNGAAARVALVRDSLAVLPNGGGAP